MVLAYRTSDTHSMPVPPPQPLHLASEQDDRVVVLGCETCVTQVDLWTGDGLFAAAVQGFFARHGRCAASIDLS